MITKLRVAIIRVLGQKPNSRASNSQALPLSPICQLKRQMAKGNERRGIHAAHCGKRENKLFSPSLGC
jgi:hypothetical protein